MCWKSLWSPLLVLIMIGSVAAQVSDPAAEVGSVVVRAPVLALVGVRVIDGTGKTPADDQTVVIVDGLIASVGPTGSITIPDEAETLELAGHTVMPGLVMLHEHLNYFSGRAVWHTQPVSYPALYLAAGVTSLRTAGTESPFVDLNLKRRIDAGHVPGPKLHLTGPFFNGAGGDFLGDAVLSTAEEAREAVEYWGNRGFTSFKVYDSILPEVLEAVVDAAHARGLTVMGHLDSVSCRQAASAGIDAIEHSFGSCESETTEDDPEDPGIQDLIRHLIDRGVVLVATPSDRRPISEEELDMLHPQARDNYLRGAIDPPEWWPETTPQRDALKLERAFVTAGGRLGVGADASDFGQIAGYANHRVLELLVEAGWQPLDVLRLATSNNAEILGVADSVGRIAPGYAADLIVLPGDPSEDIRELLKVELVFKDGVGYDPAYLRASVKGKVGWH